MNYTYDHNISMLDNFIFDFPSRVDDVVDYIDFISEILDRCREMDSIFGTIHEIELYGMEALELTDFIEEAFAENMDQIRLGWDVKKPELFRLADFLVDEWIEFEKEHPELAKKEQTGE